MKNIALLRYNTEDGDVTSNIIKSLESVCYGIFDTDLVNIVLGEDWFLIYVSDCDDVVFEAWVASDTVDNKLEQSMEMYKEFKKILLANSDKNFFASMKKTTSYNFYRKQAYAESLLPNQDELSNIEKTWTKLVPELDNDRTFLSTIADREAVYNQNYGGFIGWN